MLSFALVKRKHKLNEFSQIIMARVGYNSAVQGRADIPEGSEKLLIIFPSPDSNRNEKRLGRVADRLYNEGIGTLITDLWDEDEGGNKTLESSKSFVENRIKEIIKWAEEYKNFQGATLYLAGFGLSGKSLETLKDSYNIIKIDTGVSEDGIFENMKGLCG